MKNKRECQQGVSSILKGAAMLKPQEAKAVWTRGTENRLVLEEYRERGGMW